MKLKKIFALTLSLLMALCSAGPVFAYSDSVITGQYLELGDNHITGADPDTVSLYYFTPPSWSSYGIYRVTVTGEGARLRSYCGTVGYRYDNTNETDYDEETNSYSFTVYTSTEKRLIGVTGAEEFDISIKKIKPIKRPDWWDTSTVYSSIVPSYSRDKFNIIPPEGAELKYVDLTVPHTVYIDIDNQYHLDSKDGPILYMNMISPPYIDLYAMANMGVLRYTMPYQKNNYSDLYLEYSFCADPDLGIFPLNPQLARLLQNMGKVKGWYARELELGYYLFGDTEVCEESAWMFPLCYFEDSDAVKHRDGSKELPYSLICDDYNGSFCEIKSGNSIYYSLDVSTASEVSCMALDMSSFNVYKGFSITYGDMSFKPDSDGLISFKTNGKADTIEVTNSGTRNAFFVLALTSSTPESDGSAEAPYIASFGSDNSIVHTLESDGMMFILADTACNATAEIFALDESYSYSTEFLAYHNGEYYEPDGNTNTLSFELFELDNFYLIYNYSDKPLNIYAFLKKTAPSIPDPDGSSARPYMLYCDPYDFSSYTVQENDILSFKVNYSDSTYVIATAINENLEESSDILASYNGALHCPNAQGALIFPLTGEDDTFEILNSSDSEIYLEIAVVSDISFLTPEGSYEVPIEAEEGQYTAHIADDSAGPVYYSYTAKENCILSFEIGTEESDEWFYTIVNTETGYSTSHVFSDMGDPSCTLGVSKGDTVIIGVSTVDCDRVWLTPAGEVSWELSISDPVMGDLNFDKEVNAKDSNLLKRMISGEKGAEGGTVLFLCGDTNKDEAINAKDSNLLKKYLSGELKEF